MAQQGSPESAPATQGMPTLGIGTWQNTDPEQCTESVRTALEMGYRHVDTAQAYGNEADVGEGIAAASVPREDVFLATKVWTDRLDPDEVIESTEESLDRLGVDSLDLLYVHWAAGDYEPEETLPAFAELRDRGRIERIGVSNFEPHHLERAQSAIDAPIFANQVEMHPLLQQDALREYCEDAGIEMVAYSPLARGTVFEADVVGKIAQKHGVSEAQVSLAWLRDLGVTAIPKATSHGHIEDNWASLGLELDEEDHEAIAGIERVDRQVHPDFGPETWD